MKNNKRDDEMLLEHIQQQGPTCGIYAIAMIINLFYKLNKLSQKDGQALASNIFKIATDKNISNIGELFTVKSVETLILEINNIAELDIVLDYSICSFNSHIDLQNKLQETFANNKYCLFPYSKYYGKKNNNINILHWGVLSNFKENHIIGEQGNKNSGYFCKDKNCSSVINSTVENLYSSNKCVDELFEWKKYFILGKRIDRWINNLFYVRNKYIRKTIADITRKKRKLLKNQIVQIDIKGKMIIIGAKLK